MPLYDVGMFFLYSEAAVLMKSMNKTEYYSLN